MAEKPLKRLMPRPALAHRAEATVLMKRTAGAYEISGLGFREIARALPLVLEGHPGNSW